MIPLAMCMCTQNVATPTIILNFREENFRDQNSNHKIHENIVPQKFGAIQYITMKGREESIKHATCIYTVWRVIFVESSKRPSKLIFVVLNFVIATSPGAWHCCTSDDVMDIRACDLLCYGTKPYLQTWINSMIEEY